MAESGSGSAAASVVTRSRPNVKPWVAAMVGVAIVTAYVGTIGNVGLTEPDEARYAEIAREMVESGDWVTPHLNYVKYFEKPPLVYWLTAAAFRLFGVSDGVARLWPALFGLLGIAATYVLGRSMYGAWVGYAAAGVLATSPLYYSISQVLVLDTPLAVLMAVGLGGFWLAYASPARRRAALAVLYGAIGLAVLTKGPVAAVLGAATILAFLALRRELSVVYWLAWMPGVVLFLVITLPWFILVSWRNPEFVWFFVVDQHLYRFVQSPEHEESLWFLGAIVAAGMLPWTVVVLMAPRRALAAGWRLLTLRVSPATLYCVLWSGVIVCFFSLSKSKLGTYVLPAFCPLAILAARFIREAVEEQSPGLFTRALWSLLAVAVGLAMGTAVAAEVVDDPRFVLTVPWLYAGAAMLAATAAAGLVAVRRNGALAAMVVVLLGTLALQVVGMTGRGAVATEYQSLGRIISQQAAPGDRVVQYRHYVQGITFYAGRRTVVAGARGELDFGSRQGDQRDYFWDTDAPLLDAWASKQRMFLVINRIELEPLRARLDPEPRQIAAKGKKVVVVNFP